MTERMRVYDVVCLHTPKHLFHSVFVSLTPFLSLSLSLSLPSLSLSLYPCITLLFINAGLFSSLFQFSSSTTVQALLVGNDSSTQTQLLDSLLASSPFLQKRSSVAGQTSSRLLTGQGWASDLVTSKSTDQWKSCLEQNKDTAQGLTEEVT